MFSSSSLKKSQRIFFIFCAFLFIQTAFAQKVENTSRSSQDGIVSLIEFNPADLLLGRYRLANENLLMESVSIAWIGEVQENRKLGKYTEKNLAAGLSLQYYPQSITMTGLFVRGESDLTFAEVSEEPLARQAIQSGRLILMRMAGDVGWRVRLSERLTGSAGYGLRTALPQSLWTNNSAFTDRWLKSGDSAEVRVQVNLGLLL